VTRSRASPDTFKCACAHFPGCASPHLTCWVLLMFHVHWLLPARFAQAGKVHALTHLPAVTCASMEKMASSTQQRSRQQPCWSKAPHVTHMATARMHTVHMRTSHMYTNRIRTVRIRMLHMRMLRTITIRISITRLRRLPAAAWDGAWRRRTATCSTIRESPASSARLARSRWLLLRAKATAVHGGSCSRQGASAAPAVRARSSSLTRGVRTMSAQTPTITACTLRASATSASPIRRHHRPRLLARHRHRRHRPLAVIWRRLCATT
jgi:hypothetical protein